LTCWGAGICPSTLGAVWWLDDASNLWRLRGPKLDAERIRDTLRLLEEALGQSDLSPAFESIQKRGYFAR
jgi:hypothetical protein